MFNSNNAIIPAPLSNFDGYQNEIVAPTRTGLRGEHNPLLSNKEMRTVLRQIAEYQNELKQIGFYTSLENWERCTALLIDYRGKKLTKKDEQAIRQLIEQRKSSMRLLRPYLAIYRDLEYLNDRLEANSRERHRRRLERQISANMQDEAGYYADILSDTLSQMGYSYTYVKGKNTLTDRVQFKRAVVRPDKIYFQIRSSVQLPFVGFRNTLPHGVLLPKMLEEDNLKHLSDACRRTVTTVRRTVSGNWLVVNRLQQEDELPEKVSYRDVMKYYPTKERDKLMIPGGVREGKHLIWVPMTEQPHMLIAGTTGSGKSNLTHVIICTLLSRHTPDEVRLIMIDLKDGIDLSQYNGVPHLSQEIVSDGDDVSDVLEAVTSEMGRRLRLLTENMCKSIDIYNKRYDQKLPHLIIFFDEFQQVLSGKNRATVEKQIRRILAQGRAPGIHLILATQIPKTSVLPTDMQGNISTKFVGYMPTAAASLTALQNTLANQLERLPGRMILQVGDSYKVQVPYISDADMLSIISVAKRDYIVAPTPTLPADTQPTASPIPTTQEVPIAKPDETLSAEWQRATQQERDIYRALALGTGKLGDIAQHTNTRPAVAHKILARLLSGGYAEQPVARGAYNLTDKGKSILPVDLIDVED